jgi:hypothetical protein
LQEAVGETIQVRLAIEIVKDLYSSRVPHPVQQAHRSVVFGAFQSFNEENLGHKILECAR